jgi:hypothetical protein
MEILIIQNATQVGSYYPGSQAGICQNRMTDLSCDTLITAGVKFPTWATCCGDRTNAYVHTYLLWE